MKFLQRLFGQKTLDSPEPMTELPAEPDYSACPGKWLTLVHHLIQDPAGCGWLVTLKGEQAPLIRRGVIPLTLSGAEAHWLAEQMNKPYSELAFGLPVTPDDIEFARNQKFSSQGLEE